jgi:NAD(P)-dependent dehydrogenase (short-subunit alcohol dehydrogenase family)
VAKGVTVLVGSRNLERGEAAAREIGAGAIALQFDVADRVSIADAAERIRENFGRLDLLVQDAAISNTRKGSLPMQEYFKISRASNASLDEVRTVWETNVFGVLAVYQEMLPLLRESSDARIVNVSSGVGSLTENANPARPYHPMFGPILPCVQDGTQRDNARHERSSGGQSLNPDEHFGLRRKDTNLFTTCRVTMPTCLCS